MSDEQQPGPEQPGQGGPGQEGPPGAGAVGHLQAAALELIAAARASLDALERVVADPQALAPLVDTVSELGRMAAEAARSYGARAAPGHRPPAEDPAGPPEPGRRPAGVERIRVS